LHQTQAQRSCPSDRGFLKDKYTFETLKTSEVPIPQIFSTRKYSDGKYYCISEMVEGVTPKDQYKNENFGSLSLQFEMIENIKNFKIPKEYSGYGELEIGADMRFATLESYLMNIYTSSDVFNWNELRKLSFFDQSFVGYLVSKVQEFSKYSGDVREVLHGDFGNDNLFIKDGKVSGVIDWERLQFADHFLDVGRVVLFCPNREETVRAALDFYKDKGYQNYKERIMLGVYFAMLRNYGTAATEGNEVSIKRTPERLKQIEELMNI
jgi:hygromycin-B 4-O-kinase